MSNRAVHVPSRCASTRILTITAGTVTKWWDTVWRLKHEARKEIWLILSSVRSTLHFSITETWLISFSADTILEPISLAHPSPRTSSITHGSVAPAPLRNITEYPYIQLHLRRRMRWLWGPSAVPSKAAASSGPLAPAASLGNESFHHGQASCLNPMAWAKSKRGQKCFWWNFGVNCAAYGVRGALFRALTPWWAMADEGPAIEWENKR